LNLRVSKKRVYSIKFNNILIVNLIKKLAIYDAEFLLDFFSEKVGGYYYNEGLNDAKAMLDKKLEDVTDSFYELEKVTEFY